VKKATARRKTVTLTFDIDTLKVLHEVQAKDPAYHTISLTSLVENAVRRDYGLSPLPDRQRGSKPKRGPAPAPVNRINNLWLKPPVKKARANKSFGFRG